MQDELKAYRPVVTLADVESGDVVFEVEIEGDDGDPVVVGWVKEHDDDEGRAYPLAATKGEAVGLYGRATFRGAIEALIERWEDSP